MAKSIQYFLEINEPGSVENVLIDFEATNPFLQFHKGDLINAAVYENEPVPRKYLGLLRVVNVEHAIWEVTTHIVDKIVVYTEAVDNTPENKLQP